MRCIKAMRLCLQERIQVANGALSISRLTLSDTGMYQCVAGNKHGEAYSNAELRVIGKTLPVCVYVYCTCWFFNVMHVWRVLAVVPVICVGSHRVLPLFNTARWPPASVLFASNWKALIRRWLRVADSDVCQRSFAHWPRPSALSWLSLSSSLLAALLIHYSSPNLSHLDDTADTYQPPQTKIYRTNSSVPKGDTCAPKRELKVVHGQQFYKNNEIWDNCNVTWVNSHVFFVSVQSFLALTCSSFLSCCSRLLSKSTKEPDAGEGGRRCVNRVQAQDVSLGCGVMAEGQRPPQRKQQVMLMLHVWSLIHWWGIWKGFCGSHCPSYGHVFCLWPLVSPTEGLYQWMENAFRFAKKLACLTGPFSWLHKHVFIFICKEKHSYFCQVLHSLFFPCCVYYRCR